MISCGMDAYGKSVHPSRSHLHDGAGQSTKGKTQQLYEWKGAQMGLDHGVMDNVLPDPDKYVWAKPSVPVDPNEYQKEWLGDVINIY